MRFSPFSSGAATGAVRFFARDQIELLLSKYQAKAQPWNHSNRRLDLSWWVLWTAEIDAIELDPAWNHGNPTGPLSRGIALVEEIDSMNATSPAYRVAHTKSTEWEGFIAGIRKNAVADGGTASDQIRQREAVISLDIPGELGMSLAQTAKRVRAKLLVIVSPQDHTVNPQPALEFAAAAGAPVVSLDSPCGHQSLACISVGPTVARFLADPTSVHGETLRDTANH